MSSPSTIASVNNNDKRKSKELALQDAQYGLVESRREQVRLQEDLSLKEKALRDTQIRHMHEMGDIKRAEERRIDEAVQKITENHETIQQLTSQLQQMQEQMNSMFDAGDFQDVESNYSGRLSHVSRQPAIMPNSRSLLSRGKILPLDTWNQSWLKEHVFGFFSAFDSPRSYSQRIQSDDVQRIREAVPEAERAKTGRTSEDRQNEGTMPMPTFAPRPLTTSSTIPAELQRNYVVGQKRQQVSELQYDKSPNPQSFSVWKIRFKTQVASLF